jgi:hypothetical protein
MADARKLSADTIQSATGGGMAFRPAADGYILSNDVSTLYRQGKFNDTPGSKRSTARDCRYGLLSRTRTSR